MNKDDFRNLGEVEITQSKESLQKELAEKLAATKATNQLKENAEKDLIKLQIKNAEKIHQIRINQIKKELDEATKAEMQKEALREKALQNELDRQKRIADYEKAQAESVFKLVDDLNKQEYDKKNQDLEKALEQIKKTNKKELEALKEKYKEIHRLENEIEKEANDVEKENKKKQKNDLEKQAEIDKKHFNEKIEGEINYQKRLRERKELLEEINKETELGAKFFKSPVESIVGLAESLRGESFKGGFEKVTNFVGGIAESLNTQIDSIAAQRGRIDTRLQGWTMSGRGGNLQRLLNGGSYWDQMTKDMIGIAGVSRFITQEKFGANINSMVEKGIAANVEQRAFLATISDKIATTFEAANGTLLRLVRIQQQDTTASRLGMEAALNSFLNNMYETTEYMGGIANGVKQNLEESMALMTGKAAVGYEYQVQKWIGSLYSVGLSQNAVGSISSALGSLSAGKIEGITGGGAGNLMVMAANNANISIADILAKGLDESSTNQLMQAMVNYLAKLYDESRDSRVVQQQIANVYGLSASDLKAAAGLAKSTGVISNNFVNYNTGIGALSALAATMGQRTSIGEQTQNIWNNLQYSMSAGIASSPALYAIYKASNLMRAVGSQMDIPEIAYLGTTVNLQTSLANLMSAGALAGGLLSNIGGLASAFGSNVNGAAMLALSGALTQNSIHRGAGLGAITASGATVSESGYAGNSSSEDIQNKTMSDANDSANAQLEEQKNSAEDITIANVYDEVVLIYELLDSWNDFGALKVKYDTSGLQ